LVATLIGVCPTTGDQLQVGSKIVERIVLTGIPLTIENENIICPSRLGGEGLSALMTIRAV